MEETSCLIWFSCSSPPLNKQSSARADDWAMLRRGPLHQAGCSVLDRRLSILLLVTENDDIPLHNRGLRARFLFKSTEVNPSCYFSFPPLPAGLKAVMKQVQAINSLHSRDSSLSPLSPFHVVMYGERRHNVSHRHGPLTSLGSHTATGTVPCLAGKSYWLPKIAGVFLIISFTSVPFFFI